MKHSPLKKQSKRPMSALMREAKKVFNSFIRARDKIRLGGKCYTCNAPGTDAGHFIHNRNSVRFSEIAVNLQCLTCNQYRSGNLGEYAIRLVKDYGLKKVDDLRRLATKTKRFSRQELEEIIQTYKAKLDSLILTKSAESLEKKGLLPKL